MMWPSKVRRGIIGSDCMKRLVTTRSDISIGQGLTCWIYIGHKYVLYWIRNIYNKYVLYWIDYIYCFQSSIELICFQPQYYTVSNLKSKLFGHFFISDYIYVSHNYKIVIAHLQNLIPTLVGVIAYMFYTS